MYKEEPSLVEKRDICQRYAMQVKSLKEWRGNRPPQRLWSSISVDFLEMPASEQGHVAILNIQDDLSRFGVCIPVKKMTAAQTAFIYYTMLYSSLGNQKSFALTKDLVLLKKWLPGLLRLKISLEEPELHIILNQWV